MRAVVSGSLGWLVAYAVLALATAPFLPIAALALGGVASGVSGPAKGALNYETAPESDRATVLGLYGTLWAVGSTLGPVLGGAVAGRTSAAIALLALAGLSLCQAILVGGGLRGAT